MWKEQAVQPFSKQITGFAECRHHTVHLGVSQHNWSWPNCSQSGCTVFFPMIECYLILLVTVVHLGSQCVIEGEATQHSKQEVALRGVTGDHCRRVCRQFDSPIVQRRLVMCSKSFGYGLAQSFGDRKSLCNAQHCPHERRFRQSHHNE